MRNRLLDRLATAASERPDEPWLFYRPGLDWRWQSWARAADRVARAATSWSAAAPNAGSTLEIPPTLRPEDRIAAILAAEALAWTVRLEDGERVPSATVSSATAHRLRLGDAELFLPAGRAYLDREPLQSVDDWVVRGGPGSPFDSVLEALQVEAVVGARKGTPRRPMLFVQSELLGDGPRLRALTEASLKMDAAWILEPQEDAMVATILWSRPTHVVLRHDGLAALIDAWTPSAAKHSRLRRVLLWGAGHVGTDGAARLGVSEIGCFG